MPLSRVSQSPRYSARRGRLFPIIFKRGRGTGHPRLGYGLEIPEIAQGELLMSTSRQFAIVTGASTGIGLELAKCCARGGFDLLIAADEPQIESAATDIRALGAAVETV